MSGVLVELSFYKAGPKNVMVFRSSGECLGYIQQNAERGIIFYPSQYTDGLTMVEMGIIQSKMDDIQHGW